MPDAAAAWQQANQEVEEMGEEKDEGVLRKNAHTVALGGQILAVLSILALVPVIRRLRELREAKRRPPRHRGRSARPLARRVAMSRSTPTHRRFPLLGH